MIFRLMQNWRIACDPENRGRESHWFETVPESAQATPVPGIIQQVFPGYHGVAWYWHSFRLASAPGRGERVLLRFGAVDYLAEVWVNGKVAGSFEGGETPFSFDITDLVRGDCDNLLAVRVLNPTDEPIDGYVLDQIPHRNKVMTLPEKGQCIGVFDFLYHKECVAKRHPVFEGLQGPGVMDMDYYGPVIPSEVFIDQTTPDETLCAGFNTGYHAVAGGYRSSLLLAAYNSGKGRFILNTLRILENLDKHPAADRLAVNLIQSVKSRRNYSGI